MTILSEARKKSIREKLKAKIQGVGYKKGHVAKTKGKLIKDIKPVKKKEKTDLKAKFGGKTDSAAYKKALTARKHAQKAKKVMFKKPESGAKSVAQKTYATGAAKGKTVAHAKKVGETSVAAGKPKGPGLKYTAANKDWRKTAMAAAKNKTYAKTSAGRSAKRKAMQAVDAGYRKKVGLKAKKYT